MSTQPEALRLANVLEAYQVNYVKHADIEASAAELRRLHMLNQELLEMLQQALPIIDTYRRSNGGYGDVTAILARAAIAKAEAA